MLRAIKLHGSLDKVVEVSEFDLDVNTQAELFAALKARSSKLDMALRHAGEVALVSTNLQNEELTVIEPGFSFGSTAAKIHLFPPIEGGWVAYPILTAIVTAIAAAVISYGLTMLLNHMKTNSNGSGGAKSTMFNGPVNSTDQGGPIPIIYGKKVLVGSTVISVAEDYYNTV